MAKFSANVLILAAATVLAGCGGITPETNYDAMRIQSAGGKITLDGRPLPNAVVTFEASDGTYSYAMTDSDGEYELQFDSEMEGVRPGPKTVRISTTRKLLGLNVAEGDDPNATGETEQGKPKAIQKPQELVPTRYNEESELTVEVTPDEKTYNFDLTTSA